MRNGSPRHPSGNRPLRCLLLICVCIHAASQSKAANARIYRCENGSNPVLYSQFRCPGGDAQTTVEPAEHSFITIPALSAEETTALAALERSLRQSRVAAKRSRTEQMQQQRRASANAAKLCTAAIAGLERVRERKREGYSAAEVRRLDREQRMFSVQKKANC